jgi:hypothetical protein
MHISSLQEALICLRTQWPPKEGRDSRSFKRAVRLCTEAADGERSPAAARAAFIAAAREAGILGGSDVLKTTQGKAGDAIGASDTRPTKSEALLPREALQGALMPLSR